MSPAEGATRGDESAGPGQTSAWSSSTVLATGDRRLKIALYVAAVFLFWFAQYVFVPILPTYVQSKTTNLGIVGLALAMYGLWQAIVRLPVGIVSDWSGSR